MEVSDFTHYETSRCASEPYSLSSRTYYTQAEVDEAIAKNPECKSWLLKVTAFQLPEIERLIKRNGH